MPTTILFSLMMLGAGADDLARFQGGWQQVSAERQGKKAPADQAKRLTLDVHGNQFILRKDMKLTWPRAETPTHWMVMGLNPNLEEAMKIAVRETILFLTKRFPRLSREEAYMIASVAVDYHVTQVVDGTKGIHGMIPKSIFIGQ